MFEFINKENYKQYLVALLIVVVIIIFISYNNILYQRYLYGMWIADDDFCNESDLDGFMIMMGPSQGGYITDTRSMYVVMYNDDGMLCNRTLEVRLGNTMVTSEYQNRSIHIVDEDFDIMPRDMTLSTSIMKGHMVLYGGDDGKTIYGSLYKDHDSTHKAQALQDKK